MLYITECPWCEKEIEVKEYVNGTCPLCNRKYLWDGYTYDDEWIVKDE